MSERDRLIALTKYFFSSLILSSLTSAGNSTDSQAQLALLFAPNKANKKATKSVILCVLLCT